MINLNSCSAIQRFNLALSGIVGIYYREITVLRKKLPRVVAAASVPPFLYLMAFGFGVGQDTQVHGVPYLQFLIPGLISMASMNQSYSIATEINISRFYLKIFEEFLLAPNERWQIMAAEMLYGMTRGLIPIVIVYIYSLPCDVNLQFGLQTFLALILHFWVFALIGFTVALKMKHHRDQASMNAFVITPMMFLSGTFFPVDQMPTIIQWLAALSPLTYSAELIRAGLLGKPLEIQSVLALLGLIAVLTAYGLNCLKKMEP